MRRRWGQKWRTGRNDGNIKTGEWGSGRDNGQGIGTGGGGGRTGKSSVREEESEGERKGGDGDIHPSIHLSI